MIKKHPKPLYLRLAFFEVVINMVLFVQDRRKSSIHSTVVVLRVNRASKENLSNLLSSSFLYFSGITIMFYLMHYFT